MTRVKKLALTLMLALTVAAGGAATLGGTAAVANGGPGAGKVQFGAVGDPSQWGVAKKGSFDPNSSAGDQVAADGKHIKEAILI